MSLVGFFFPTLLADAAEGIYLLSLQSCIVPQLLSRSGVTHTPTLTAPLPSSVTSGRKVMKIPHGLLLMLAVAECFPHGV